MPRCGPCLETSLSRWALAGLHAGQAWAEVPHHARSSCPPPFLPTCRLATRPPARRRPCWCATPLPWTLWQPSTRQCCAPPPTWWTTTSGSGGGARAPETSSARRCGGLEWPVWGALAGGSWARAPQQHPLPVLAKDHCWHPLPPGCRSGWWAHATAPGACSATARSPPASTRCSSTGVRGWGWDVWWGRVGDVDPSHRSYYSAALSCCCLGAPRALSLSSLATPPPSHHPPQGPCRGAVAPHLRGAGGGGRPAYPRSLCHLQEPRGAGV